MLITLEGTDGSGKDTVAAALKDALESKGLKVVVLNEPGRDGLGAQIREIMLDADEEYHLLTQLYLMVAARTDNLLNKIIPLIKNGYTVICTRGPMSTVVYQLFPLLAEESKLLHKEVTTSAASAIYSTDKLIEGSDVNDHRFYITCPPEVSRERTLNRGMLDIIERKSSEFHKTCRELYDTLSTSLNYTPVSNEGKVEDCISSILKHLNY